MLRKALHEAELKAANLLIEKHTLKQRHKERYEKLHVAYQTKAMEITERPVTTEFVPFTGGARGAPVANWRGQVARHRAAPARCQPRCPPLLPEHP